MKLRGDPGTLLACGKAPDTVRCATKDTQYKLHPDSRSQYHVFFRGSPRTGIYHMTTLYIVVAGTLRHSPQVWLDPLVRAIISPKELTNIRMIAI